MATRRRMSSVDCQLRMPPEAVQYLAGHPLRADRSSVSGRALVEGRAIHVADLAADPEYGAAGFSVVGGYRTLLSVPLVRGGTIIGVFGLTRDEVNPFTDKQIELVTTFADQAVIAIENTRLFEGEQQRTRELTESLEQQTATSEVLQVISRSPGDLSRCSKPCWKKPSVSARPSLVVSIAGMVMPYTLLRRVTCLRHLLSIVGVHHFVLARRLPPLAWWRLKR